MVVVAEYCLLPCYRMAAKFRMLDGLHWPVMIHMSTILCRSLLLISFLNVADLTKCITMAVPKTNTSSKALAVSSVTFVEGFDLLRECFILLECTMPDFPLE
jgi:hypothetical protein